MLRYGNKCSFFVEIGCQQDLQKPNKQRITENMIVIGKEMDFFMVVSLDRNHG